MVHPNFIPHIHPNAETMFQPNLVAILAAGLLPMLLGSLWYGPLFGKMWMNLIGKTEEEIRANMKPVKMYVVTFIMALIMAYVLSYAIEGFVAVFGKTGLLAGAQVGFWLWLGLVLTAGYQAVAFEDKNLRLFIINMAYNLVTLLAMGALLGVWR